MKWISSPRATTSLAVLILGSMLLLAGPGPAGAQVMDRIGDAAARAAENETKRQVRRGVRNAIRCVVGDRICQDRARREGREVVILNATWDLELGDREWEGEAGEVLADEVLFALHLAADDDASLYLFLSDDDEDRHVAEAVVVASDDGDRCRYPYEGSAPFVVRLDRVDSDIVAGTYEGMVWCDDESAETRTRGTFQVAR